MADDNDARRIKAAFDELQKEILPAVAKAYDDLGPEIVLVLGVAVADLWRASGFSVSDWRELMNFACEPQGQLKAVKS
jgi:hypothetical protein